MTPYRSSRTYHVSWDQGSDEDVFVAPILLDGATGEPIRWNGFVVPLLSRADVEKIGALAAPDNGFCRVHFDGDIAVVSDPQYDDEPDNAPDRVEPDEHGLYSLGAFQWTWAIVPPDLDPAYQP